MWFKKVKKKKLQSFLIGSLLFLTSLIFASSLSLITSIQGYVNEYYSNEKFYDIILFHTDEKATKDLLQWSENHSEIKDVKAIDSYTSGNDLYLNGKNLKLPLYNVVPLEDMQEIPLGLNKVQSLDEESFPKEGEIWLTQLLADNLNIALGDHLTFKTKNKDITLKVSSLINDSIQPSSTSDLITLYTNKNSAQDFSSYKKSPLVLIDTTKDADLSKLKKDLNSEVNVGGFTLDKNMFILSATMTATTTGGVSTLASLLVFIVSMLLIRFIIWNNILKEYKSIGIYKALGFSRHEILKFYITGYSLTAIIATILGAFSSIPVLNYTASRILKYIGEFNGVEMNFTVIFATILLFSLVVIINLYFVIRRTNKITPVDAFRTGTTSSKKKLTKSLIKNTTAPIALAINDIFKYKKISSYITLSLTLSLSLVLLFGNFNVTISKMKENTNVWFGLPKSNITISSSLASSSGELKVATEEVKLDPRVKNYVYGSLLFPNVKLDTNKYPIKSSLYTITVLNSYDEDLGFTITEGYNPKKEKEVAVSENILKDVSLSVGDYIELTMNNKKTLYFISGSYNSLMNNGYSIRMLNSAIEKEFPDFIGSELFVNLKDPSKTEEFQKDLNTKFTSLEASDIHPLLKYSIQSMPTTILPISYLLIVVFIAFSSITILNIILMNIRDNRRNFGILKALGFTSKEIILRYLYRILILTFISTTIAVILNLTISKPLIAAAISQLDVLILSPITMISLVTGMTLLVILITLLASKNIKNTKPTELIEE